MPSSIVIDTNAIVYYLTDTSSLGESARNFLRGGAFHLIAPPLFQAEVESALNMLCLHKRLTKKDLLIAREVLDDMGIDIIHLPGTHITARKIADKLRLPRVYDATFAALALLQKVDFFTADRTFYNAARRSYSFVQFIP